jgi:CRP/FNR family transcriptional regulator, cyclic AMP receptor protein
VTAVTQRVLGLLIADSGVRRRYRAGSVLFHQGDRGRLVYGIAEGCVALTVPTGPGRELLLATKVPGDCFGEMSALDGQPRSARAVALEDTVVGQLEPDGFMALLEENAALAVELLRRMSDVLRETNRRLGDIAGADTTTRVARRLVDLAMAARELLDVSEGPQRLSVTQDDLAIWLGTTRESVARALARLRNERCVTTGRGRIVITDMAALRRLAA